MAHDVCCKHMNFLKKRFKKPKKQEAVPFAERTMNTPNPNLRSLSTTVALIIAAPILALLMTSHVFHSYQVDGLSMAATLDDGDRLIVNKLPKTISNLTDNAYIPKRWDIIVFDKPRQVNSGTVEHLIKRVIALPGERIVVQDGDVTVYNSEFPDGFNPDENTDYSSSITRTAGNVDITVGQDEVFVMGDNRSNSTDSRAFGPIHYSVIVGSAELRFLPTNSIRRL